MNRRAILLATDLSCRCDRALDRAILLAGEWNARLVVLHAMPRTAIEGDHPSWRRDLDPRTLARRRILEDLRGGAVEFEIVVERNEPEALIRETLASLGPALLVTGIARDEPLGRFLLGGTVEGLARRPPVPMLVVKARPLGPYRNAVVATDFSEASRRALRTALELLPPSAGLTLFQAGRLPFDQLIDDPADERARARDARLAEMRAFLEATPDAADARDRIRLACEDGSPAELLEDLVRGRGMDLVVLGSPGRGTLANLLLGSVGGELLGRSPVDVLLAPPPDL